MSTRILGAGPAGLAAAIVLARRGVEVDVYERRATCGARFGGDLQGLENWSGDADVLDELRSAGIATDFYAAPLTTAIQTNGTRDDRLTCGDRPLLYLVKRGTAADTLDQALMRQAVAAGVRLHFRASLAVDRADIVATGPDARHVFAVDKGIVFDTDAPDIAVVLLDDEVAPKGYAYLLVTHGYGCLCTMLFEDFSSAAARLARARALLLSRYGVRVANERSVGGIGHFALDLRFRDGHACRIGEASGLQDFLFGFGIRSAMQSGVLAARCLLDGSDWEAAAQRRFGPWQSAGVVNRFAWELLRRGHYRLPMAAFRHGGAEPMLRWLARFGVVHRAMLPFARAHARRAHPRLAL